MNGKMATSILDVTTLDFTNKENRAIFFCIDGVPNVENIPANWQGTIHKAYTQDIWGDVWGGHKLRYALVEGKIMRVMNIGGRYAC